MKAVVYDTYGPPDVLQLRETPPPPQELGLVRVKVHAAALNPKDVLIRKGKMRWLSPSQWPRISGYDFAGTLLDDTPNLRAGDEVYGMIQSHLGGACAQMIALPPDQLAKKPASLSMVEAASLPLAALTALQGLRDELVLQPGQRVLLNGASGGVGTMAVQMAKHMDAQVMAVCSGKNAEWIESLGADHVIDYTKTSLNTLRQLDCVYDIYGSFPWNQARFALKPWGRYCTTIPRATHVVRGVLRKVGWHRAALVIVQSRRKDLDVLTQWVEQGVLKPIIDGVYDMDQAAQAHAHLETRRTRGKVVMRIQD